MTRLRTLKEDKTISFYILRRPKQHKLNFMLEVILWQMTEDCPLALRVWSEHLKAAVHCLKIKCHCGWYNMQLLCGCSHDVDFLCPPFYFFTGGMSDMPWQDFGMQKWLMLLQHSPGKFFNIGEQCRWQVKLQAQCPVWSSFSRFGSSEGQSNGSGTVTGCCADYQRCMGAIRHFMLGFHKLFGKEVKLLIGSILYHRVSLTEYWYSRIQCQGIGVINLLLSCSTWTDVRKPSSEMFYRELGRIFSGENTAVFWSWQRLCDLCAISANSILRRYQFIKTQQNMFLHKNIKNSLGYGWFSEIYSCKKE